MRLIMLFLLPTLAIHLAFADASLEQKAKDEKRWRPAEIWSQEATKNLMGTGFITTNNEWRLDQVATQIEVMTSLESKFASKYGVAAFRGFCERMKYGFNAVSAYGNHYAIRLSLPNWSTVLLPLKGPQKMTLVKAQPRVQFQSDSYTNKYSGVDPRSVEREIGTQVREQLDQLAEAGSVVVDLSGKDFVACDFVEGKVQLGLEATWDYSAAKVYRSPTVAEREIAQALERSQVVPLGDRTCGEKAVLASALFATNLTGTILKNVPTMGAGSYVDAFNGLFDYRLCQWLTTENIRFSDVASAFDELSEKQVRATSHVKSVFNGVIK